LNGQERTRRSTETQREKLLINQGILISVPVRLRREGNKETQF